MYLGSFGSQRVNRICGCLEGRGDLGRAWLTGINRICGFCSNNRHLLRRLPPAQLTSQQPTALPQDCDHSPCRRSPARARRARPSRRQQPRDAGVPGRPDLSGRWLPAQPAKITPACNCRQPAASAPLISTNRFQQPPRNARCKLPRQDGCLADPSYPGPSPALLLESAVTSHTRLHSEEGGFPSESLG